LAPHPGEAVALPLKYGSQAIPGMPFTLPEKWVPVFGSEG